MKTTDHVDFNDKNLNNVVFIKVNSIPSLEEHLTPKLYADQAFSNIVDDSSLLRLDPDEKSGIDEQNSILLNSTLTLTKTIKKLPTKFYVDNTFEDPKVFKNTAHVDFNDKNLDKVRFVKIDSMPAVGEHLTAKFQVDNAIFIV